MKTVSIPIIGKLSIMVDPMDYNTCDGQRFVADATEDLHISLSRDIKVAVDLHTENIVRQIIAILAETGLWPVERTLLMVPAMYQHEEDFTEEARSRLIKHDIEFAERVFESYKKNRPNNYKKYLRGGA